jgi:tetratricopeptide (TPR) repeat protein
LEGPDIGSEIWRLEQLAGAWSDLGEDAEAEATYRGLLGSFAGHPAAEIAGRNGLAGLMRAKGELEMARGFYRQVAEAATDASQRDWALLNSATILEEQGRLDDAFFALRSLQRNTSDPEVRLQARLGMAAVYLEKGRAEMALELLEGEDASDLGPAWVASMAQIRVAARVASNDLDGAEREWQEVLDDYGQLDDAASQARLGIAEVALQKGEFSRAVALADRVLETSPDRFYQAQAILGKARALGSAGEGERALSLLDALLRDYSDQPEMLEAARELRRGI